jgi:hypothetical protein
MNDSCVVELITLLILILIPLFFSFDNRGIPDFVGRKTLEKRVPGSGITVQSSKLGVQGSGF